MMFHGTTVNINNPPMEDSMSHGFLFLPLSHYEWNQLDEQLYE